MGIGNGWNLQQGRWDAATSVRDLISSAVSPPILNLQLPLGTEGGGHPHGKALLVATLQRHLRPPAVGQQPLEPLLTILVHGAEDSDLEKGRSP